jgi:hypothetical protein
LLNSRVTRADWRGGLLLTPVVAIIAAVFTAFPASAYAFQRMGVLSGQSVTLTFDGSHAKVQARCMDKEDEPPEVDDRFTQVLNGGVDAVRVTNLYTRSSVSLAEALSQGLLEITGELDPTSPEVQLEVLKHGGVGPTFYDGVVIKNKSRSALRIDFTGPVVLGGPSHSAFPFPAEQLVNKDQHATWDAVKGASKEADARAARVEAERRELEIEHHKQEAEREVRERHARAAMLDVQRDLRAAGQETPADGSPSEATRRAIETIQRKLGLPVTGAVDSATAKALEQQHRDAETWLRSTVGYYKQVTEPVGLGKLEEAVGLPKDAVLTESVRTKVVGPLVAASSQARPVLASLGYTVPPDDDPIAWSKLVSDFQRAHCLTDARAGILDKSTLTRLKALSEAMTKSERLPLGDRASTSEPLLSVLARKGDKLSTQYFRVDRTVAELVTTTFNEAAGQQVIQQCEPPGDGNAVLLAVSDTSGLADTVQDVLDTQELGRRVALSNGKAFRQLIVGGKAVIVSAGSETQIDVVPERVDGAFKQIWRLLNQSSPADEQRRRISALVRERVAGADVAFVVGPELDDIDIERVARVPVVRSAETGRSLDEVKALFESASRRPLDPKRMLVINGLPKNDAEYNALVAHDLQGPSDLWLKVSRDITDYLHSLKVPVKATADQSLKNSADVIVVFAHSSDGRKVLLPTRDGAIELRAEDLARYSENFRERKPTILLMACATGGVGDSSPTMAQHLIALGAGAVIAPKDPIDPRTAREFLEVLFNQDPSMSLVARVSASLKDARFGDGNVRFLVFNRHNAEQKSVYELLPARETARSGTRQRS